MYNYNTYCHAIKTKDKATKSLSICDNQISASSA